MIFRPYQLLWKIYYKLGTVTEPLNQLLHKDDNKQQWNPDCITAFPRLQTALSLSLVLAHYDPNNPLRLTCGASAYAVGAVIHMSHQVNQKNL